jgi:predicted CXXCH cytochrome family protein
LADLRGDISRAVHKPLWRLILAAFCALLFGCTQGEPLQQPLEANAPSYVGAEACVSCHAAEGKLWRASQHNLSMQVATPASVLGNFDNTHFEDAGTDTRFLRRDGSFWVRTAGSDGSESDFEAAYTFGVEPLQQYLLKLSRGRYQAFNVAWDTRSAQAGGQRWFPLHGPDAASPTDALQWSGRLQNWNGMCADCHSTHLKKNYSIDEDRFETTWASISVSCEACHGPGSEHVRDPAQQLALGPVARAWVDTSGSGIAQRTPEAADRRELETCARCHSRRTELSEDFEPGGSLLSAYRPALLESGLYRADGQILDEVYVYGSFLQSAMYRAGVTCSDCHDPHSAGLRASGNSLCAQCHAPSRFDTTAHHHHSPGSAGAQCVACHMPSRLYMVVDERRDHSLRVPRPDLSLTLGTPNACTQCHQKQTAQWAATAVAEWFPDGRSGHEHYGQGIAAGRNWAADRSQRLRALALDPQAPAIARATALELMSSQLDAAMLDVIKNSLADAEPLVQLAALDALSGTPPASYIDLVQPLLDDPLLAIRIEAARALVPARDQLAGERRHAFDAALDEYLDAQRLNADRADGHYNLGRVFADLGQFDEALAAFRAAIVREPAFAPAYINLADLYRQRGDETETARVLEEGATANPDNPAVLLALGLARVRQGEPAQALQALERAAQLAPADPYYQYVLGVALYSTGSTTRGLQTLQAAHERFPGHSATLLALATMFRDRGETERALEYARALNALSPGDASARALLEQLQRSQQR